MAETPAIPLFSKSVAKLQRVFFVARMPLESKFAIKEKIRRYLRARKSTLNDVTSPSIQTVAIKATEACEALAAGLGAPAGLFCVPRNKD
jgi:hypothetical protein